MSLFVTVGSTSFDDLIDTICSQEILQVLSKNGVKKITFQIGHGKFIPNTHPDIEIEWFRLKDSISEDIKNATLVIGHAGAGTILECLSEKKRLIAVLNEKLMDNHQCELAEQMAKDGFLLFCSLSKLQETLCELFSTKRLRTYISEPNMFAGFLEEIMGLV